jgi:hypothetical protein
MGDGILSDPALADSVEPLPSHVLSFVHRHISSLLQLEALLLVFEGGQRTRSPTELSAEMYVPASVLEQWLDGFTASGLCVQVEGGYRMPDSPDVYEILREVADCYLRRRISLSRAVFEAGRDDPRTSLSEAFRFRKDR